MTQVINNTAALTRGPHEPARSRFGSLVRRTTIVLVATAAVAAAGTGVYEATGRGPSPTPAAGSGQTGRPVTVTSPSVSAADTELILPAQALPNEQTTLHPRVDGYVAKWHADRGARVVAGQLLAEIDAPELDQQARQAQATLDRGRATVAQLTADRDQAAADADAAVARVRLAEADAVLAERELERVAAAAGTGVASRTDHDTTVRNRDAAVARIAAAKADSTSKAKTVTGRDAAIVTQEATVRGLEADLARLRELQKFKRVVAPFTGTVTRRHAEVGMLVATNGTTPLFHVQDSSVLRVQVDVPQRYAAAARRAGSAEVLVPELPDRALAATVARTANALDAATRTLRVELDLPNADRAVLAGAFVQVRLRVAEARPAVTVPVGALQYTPEGVRVAVVGGGKVDLRAVALGRDFGKSVQVTAGLTGAERLVLNPPDDLRAGEAVRVVGE